MKQCRKCGVELINDNWTISRQKQHDYICKSCAAEYMVEYYIQNCKKIKARSCKWKYTHGGRSMLENKKCTSYLGVHVAERVLSHVFKNVKRMPPNHKGYDFKCGQGYMIDIKSSCRYIEEKCSDRWHFTINKNSIADYFLCLAFDNRESLNPEYIWLIPGKDVNDKTGIGISETTLFKWDCYKLDKLKDVISCCNIIRSMIKNE